MLAGISWPSPALGRGKGAGIEVKGIPLSLTADIFPSHACLGVKLKENSPDSEAWFVMLPLVLSCRGTTGPKSGALSAALSGPTAK